MDYLDKPFIPPKEAKYLLPITLVLFFISRAQLQLSTRVFPPLIAPYSTKLPLSYPWAAQLSFTNRCMEVHHYKPSFKTFLLRKQIH